MQFCQGHAIPRLDTIVVRPQRIPLPALPDRLRLLFDNGHAVLDSTEGVLAHLVGLVGVGLDVLDRRLEVGLGGLAEAVVDVVGEVEGLLAVGVGFEGVDAAGDGGVGGELGEGFGGRAGAVAVWQGVGGGVRHCCGVGCASVVMLVWCW